jgi:hypothetical protein
MKKLSAVAVLLMFLVWLPAWGQDQAKPESTASDQSTPKLTKPYPFNRESRKQEYLSESASGSLLHRDYRKDPEALERRLDAEEKASKGGEPVVQELTPRVTDRNGRVLSPEEVKQHDLDKWNKMHTSGKCAAAAKKLTKEPGRVTACTGQSPIGPCREFAEAKYTVAVCAVSPDTENRGRRIQQINANPLPTALEIEGEEQAAKR